jgi:hypothetical protein
MPEASQQRAKFYQQSLILAACLIAAAVIIYTIATLSTDPLGMLNLATALGFSGLLFVSVYLATAPLTWWQRADAWATARRVRLPFLLLAIGLGTITAVRYAVRLQINLDFSWIVTTLWLLTLLSLILAVVPAPSRVALAAWVRANAAEIGFVAAATAIGGLLRFVALGAIPNIINGDEGLHGIWALDTGEAYGQLTTPFGAMDGLGILYLSVKQQLFDILGQNPFALRLLPAIAGTLALPANYLLARRLLGPRAAVITVALLVAAHAHVHFSRTAAVLYIYTTLFLPLALYLLISAFERRSPFRFVLCAVTVGIHLNVYLDGWAWLVLMFLIMIAWALIDRSIFHGNGANLAIFGVSLAVVLAPMIIWAFEFPDAFGSRLGADGTIASGWLANESAITGRSQAAIMFDLLLTALGTFSFLPFLDFYGIRQPTLDRLSGLLWIPGAALALLKTWNRRIVMLNGWFWGGIVALGVLTIPPSSYHYRLIVVLPVVCIFAALFADWLLRQVDRFTALEVNYRRLLANGIVAIVAVTVIALNVNLYFGQFVGRCMYSGIGTRQAGLFGNYLAQIDGDAQAFVLPNEFGFRYGNFPSIEFLSRRMPIENIDEPLGAQPPAALAAASASEFVVAVPPERNGELTQLAAWYPQGAVVPVDDCGNTILTLFHVRR